MGLTYWQYAQEVRSGVKLEDLIIQVGLLKATNPAMTNTELMRHAGTDRGTIQLCLDFIAAEKCE